MKIIDYLSLFEDRKTDTEYYQMISQKIKEIVTAFQIPLNFYSADHYYLVPQHIKQCDCEIKILKNRTSIGPVTQWYVDGEAKFDEKIKKDLNIIRDESAATEKLQVSKLNKNVVFPNTTSTTAETTKLQMSGRKPRTEKLSKNEQLNEKYDFVNFSWVNHPIDLNAKLKRNAFQLRNPKEEQHHNPPIKQENKPSQISVCSSCNYSNEYIDYDPNYKCLKCRNGW